MYSMYENFFNSIIKFGCKETLNDNPETITVQEFLNDFYDSAMFKEFLSYHMPEYVKKTSVTPLYPSSQELFYYLTNFNYAQLCYVLYGYWLGISKEIIASYAKPNMSYSKMSLVIDMLETGIDMDIIEKEFINNISIKNFKRIQHQYLFC